MASLQLRDCKPGQPIKVMVCPSSHRFQFGYGTVAVLRTTEGHFEMRRLSGHGTGVQLTLDEVEQILSAADDRPAHAVAV